MTTTTKNWSRILPICAILTSDEKARIISELEKAQCNLEQVQDLTAQELRQFTGGSSAMAMRLHFLLHDKLLRDNETNWVGIFDACKLLSVAEKDEAAAFFDRSGMALCDLVRFNPSKRIIWGLSSEQADRLDLLKILVRGVVASSAFEDYDPSQAIVLDPEQSLLPSPFTIPLVANLTHEKVIKVSKSSRKYHPNMGQRVAKVTTSKPIVSMKSTPLPFLVALLYTKRHRLFSLLCRYPYDTIPNLCRYSAELGAAIVEYLHDANAAANLHPPTVQDRNRKDGNLIGGAQSSNVDTLKQRNESMKALSLWIIDEILKNVRKYEFGKSEALSSWYEDHFDGSTFHDTDICIILNHLCRLAPTATASNEGGRIQALPLGECWAKTIEIFACHLSRDDPKIKTPPTLCLVKEKLAISLLGKLWREPKIRTADSWLGADYESDEDDFSPQTTKRKSQDIFRYRRLKPKST